MHPRHPGGRFAYLAPFFAVTNARISKAGRTWSNSVLSAPVVTVQAAGRHAAPGRAGSAARGPAGGSAGSGGRSRPSWPPSPWPAVRPLSSGKPAPGLPFPRLSGIRGPGKYRHRGHLTESPTRTGAGCQFGPMAPPARFRRSVRSAGPRGPAIPAPGAVGRPVRRARRAPRAGGPGPGRIQPVQPVPGGSGPPSAEAGRAAWRRPARPRSRGIAAMPGRRPQGARRAAGRQCRRGRAARPPGRRMVRQPPPVPAPGAERAIPLQLPSGLAPESGRVGRPPFIRLPPPRLSGRHV
jgi:hypothetical protein